MKTTTEKKVLKDLIFSALVIIENNNDLRRVHNIMDEENQLIKYNDDDFRELIKKAKNLIWKGYYEN